MGMSGLKAAIAANAVAAVVLILAAASSHVGTDARQAASVAESSAPDSVLHVSLHSATVSSSQASSDTEQIAQTSIERLAYPLHRQGRRFHADGPGIHGPYKAPRVNSPTEFAVGSAERLMTRLQFVWVNFRNQNAAEPVGKRMAQLAQD